MEAYANSLISYYTTLLGVQTIYSIFNSTDKATIVSICARYSITNDLSDGTKKCITEYVKFVGVLVAINQIEEYISKNKTLADKIKAFESSAKNDTKFK